MTPIVRIVTADTDLAARYRAALAPFVCRRTTAWPHTVSCDPTEVVLFDPATAHSVNEDEKPWAIEMEAEIETTVRRVEQVVASRRFEAAVDARFEALVSGVADPPTVEMPGTLNVRALGALYEAL